MVQRSPDIIIFKIVFLLLALGQYGCSVSSIENISLNHKEHQLFVVSLISPRKNVIVNVRKVLNVQEEENYNVNENLDSISGAIVLISEQGDLNPDTLKEISPSIYALDSGKYQIEYGKIYKLQVQYQNQIVYASTIVPTNTDIPVISTLLYVPEKRTSNSHSEAKVLIRVKAEGTGEYHFLKTVISEFDKSGQMQNKYTLYNYYQKLQESTGNYELSIPVNNSSFYRKQIEITLASTTPEVFNFFKRINEIDEQKVKYDRNPIFAFNAILPQITNIMGGYGVFGAYSESEVIKVNMYKDGEKITF